MATTYTISEDLVVTLSGDTTLVIPINPETKKKFISYEEADLWATKAVANITLEKGTRVNAWTPYGFLQRLPLSTLAGCIELEKAQDTQMILYMRLLVVAQDIKADDPNLLSFLDYCISKGILTTEQKKEIIS